MMTPIKRVLLILSIGTLSMLGGGIYGVSLEENSPFIPFDQPARPIDFAGPARGGVELRGIMEFAGEQKFSLYNPTTKESRWVTLQESSGAYLVESYDPASQSILLMVNGIQQRLKLNKPSEISLPETRGGGFPRIPGAPPSPSRFPHEEEAPSGGEIDPEKRKEMADRVYSAFRKYVEEKKARAEGALDDEGDEE